LIVTLIGGWLFEVAVTLSSAILAPVLRPDQSFTLKNTLFSGFCGETSPEEGEIATQEALLEILNENDAGPPAPMST
jgi:hypothetical protein